MARRRDSSPVASPQDQGDKDGKPLAFALVIGRPEAHEQLLRLLQDEIIGPLSEGHLLAGFQIISATPPSFVADKSTLLVFEITLQASAPPITDRDVRQWQQCLAPDVLLAAAPVPEERLLQWGLGQARKALTRAMSSGFVVSPWSYSEDGGEQQPSGGGGSWFAPCLERDRDPDSEGGRASASAFPSFTTPNFLIEREDGIRHAAPDEVLMRAEIADALCGFLPASLRWRSAWRLAYSPHVHGVSIQTLHRRMSSEGPFLLLMQDHNDQVFGGFASVPWMISHAYFGTGETFVFKFGKRMSRLASKVSSSPQPSPRSAGPSQATAREEPRGAEGVEEVATNRALEEAVKVLTEWSENVRLEVLRSEESVAQALAAGANQSATEALDAVLGTGTPLVETPRRPLLTSQSQAPAAVSTVSPAHSDGEEADAGDACQRQGADGDLAESLEVFTWSTKDPFFLYSDADCLAMGGGSSFALYIEKDLLHGVSEPCSTFHSSMLSSTERFIISSLECWVFDDPSEVQGAK